MRACHTVPRHVLWLAVLLIGVSVGCVNFLMVFLDSKVLSSKFASFQNILLDAEGKGSFTPFGANPVANAILYMVPLSCLCTVIAAGLTVYFAPLCAGSGLPEIKGYLNGNPMPGGFSWGSWGNIRL